MGTAKSWLWADQVIPKRMSRKLRDEHNALVNSHADLLAACRAAIRLADGGNAEHEAIFRQVQAAITRATE